MRDKNAKARVADTHACGGRNRNVKKVQPFPGFGALGCSNLVGARSEQPPSSFGARRPIGAAMRGFRKV